VGSQDEKKVVGKTGKPKAAKTAGNSPKGKMKR
jgi:hypothetical protein